METEKLGIDYAVKLGYSAIEGGVKDDAEKRNMLFSLYSFRCLFDNADMTYVHPALKSNGCCFTISPEDHPLYPKHQAEFARLLKDDAFEISYGGVLVDEGGKKVVRFDAGSELHSYFAATDKITGLFSAVPEKYSLYELVYRLVTLSNATLELKGLYYLIFMYIVLIEAPHEPELYYKLKDELIAEDVFEAALYSRYSHNVPDTVGEMWELGFPNVLVEWLLPFVEWKAEKNAKGLSREVVKFQKWLAEGRFGDVLPASEKLLNSFPTDDDLLLCNIAARISFCGVKSDEDRTALLNDTLNVCEEGILRGGAKKIFFIYYSGVALIGLRRLTEALLKFEDALDLNPGFEPARLMKKACEKSLEEAESAS